MHHIRHTVLPGAIPLHGDCWICQAKWCKAHYVNAATINSNLCLRGNILYLSGSPDHDHLSFVSSKQHSCDWTKGLSIIQINHILREIIKWVDRRPVIEGQWAHILRWLNGEEHGRCSLCVCLSSSDLLVHLNLLQPNLLRCSNLESLQYIPCMCHFGARVHSDINNVSTIAYCFERQAFFI